MHEKTAKVVLPRSAGGANSASLHLLAVLEGPFRGEKKEGNKGKKVWKRKETKEKNVHRNNTYIFGNGLSRRRCRKEVNTVYVFDMKPGSPVISCQMNCDRTLQVVTLSVEWQLVSADDGHRTHSLLCRGTTTHLTDRSLSSLTVARSSGCETRCSLRGLLIIRAVGVRRGSSYRRTRRPPPLRAWLLCIYCTKMHEIWPVDSQENY